MKIITESKPEYNALLKAMYLEDQERLKSYVGNNMEWISVAERLPKFEETVLCYDRARICLAYRRKEEEYNEHWVINDSYDCIGTTAPVLLWMPIPNLPENAEDMTNKPIGY